MSAPQPKAGDSFAAGPSKIARLNRLCHGSNHAREVRNYICAAHMHLHLMMGITRKESCGESVTGVTFCDIVRGTAVDSVRGDLCVIGMFVSGRFGIRAHPGRVQAWQQNRTSGSSRCPGRLRGDVAGGNQDRVIVAWLQQLLRTWCMAESRSPAGGREPSSSRLDFLRKRRGRERLADEAVRLVGQSRCRVPSPRIAEAN